MHTGLGYRVPWQRISLAKKERVTALALKITCSDYHKRRIIKEKRRICNLPRP